MIITAATHDLDPTASRNFLHLAALHEASDSPHTVPVPEVGEDVGQQNVGRWVLPILSESPLCRSLTGLGISVGPAGREQGLPDQSACPEGHALDQSLGLRDPPGAAEEPHHASIMIFSWFYSVVSRHGSQVLPSFFDEPSLAAGVEDADEGDVVRLHPLRYHLLESSEGLPGKPILSEAHDHGRPGDHRPAPHRPENRHRSLHAAAFNVHVDQGVVHAEVGGVFP